jgi:predicted transcriptional regulator of viral defense system
MPQPSSTSPDWNALFEIAAAQDGLFTTQQAAGTGYSRPLLSHHVRSGRLERVRRGVYRLVHFPAGDHEDLTAIWLWSGQVGVFSHRTALLLADLSDVLPARADLTVPSEWRRRRMRVPEGVLLHYADLPAADRTWFGSVPGTEPLRTLADCASSGMSPDLLRQAATQAVARGLVAREDLTAIEHSLAPFGGLDP